MARSLTTLALQTTGPGLYDVTSEVAGWVHETGIGAGLLTLFCQHTSASLLITENVSSAVHRDLVQWLERAVPEGHQYEHDDEGPDDMPAHIKAMLTGSSLVVPVLGGRPALGTWQGLFLAEHRRRPHRRSIVVHLAGD
jgi:secondary thiamine-phosphate synthase enzyme